MNEPPLSGYDQARSLEKQGQYVAAEQIYQALYQQNPEGENLCFRLGLLKHRQGNLPVAARYYQEALSQQPGFWSCRFNLAELLLSLGDVVQAGQHYQKALADCQIPAARAEILSRLAHLALQMSQEVQASQYLLAAQQAHPMPQYDYALAQIYQRLNQMPEARQHANQALQRFEGQQIDALQRDALQPQQAQTLRKYLAYAAHLQVASLAYPQARDYYQRYYHLSDSPHEQALSLAQIANCWQEENQPERALETYEQALAHAHHPTLALAQAFVLPIVYRSQAELLDWRQGLQQRIQAWSQQDYRITDPQTLTALPTYLAYQGYNDCEILSQLGQAIQKALPALTSGNLNRRRTSGQRKRLGCLSRYFYRHSVLAPFRGLLTTLAQEFELVLISLDPLIEDSLTHDLRREAAAWVPLQGTISQQLEQIQALELDGLMYTDCGLDPVAYLLAHYRLAPVQMLLPGQPLTSGIPQLDYFISERYSEPARAQTYYSEKLILMPELFTYQAFPNVPLASHSREQLGLPQGRIYLCPVQVQKLVPLMDTAFVQILSQDSEAQLVFIDFSERGLEKQFITRLQMQLTPEQGTRLHLKPRYNSHTFWQVLFQAEVVLESFPFGSWNTLVQALAAESCVVALASECLRGRYALGIFRQMQIEETVAESIADYVTIAIRYANDPHLRAAYRERLRQQRGLFFERRDVLSPLLEWLHQTLA